MLSCNYSMGEQNLHLKFTEIDNSFVVRHSHRENKSPAVFVSKEKKMGTEVRIITPLITMDCAPADIFFSFDKDTLTDLKTPLKFRTVSGRHYFLRALFLTYVSRKITENIREKQKAKAKAKMVELIRTDELI